MRPNTRKITKITMKMKNRIFAIPAVAAAMPVNPKSAAMIEMMKKEQCPFEHIDGPGKSLLNG